MPPARRQMTRCFAALLLSLLVDLFLYIAVENLLDRIYTTGRTSEGVISTGEPRMARAGLRLRF